MTAEDRAYNRIVTSIETSTRLLLVSGHPPSGKAYFTDLIRIPAPRKSRSASRRWHIDLIFCSRETIYFCELKGRSSESSDDEEKLTELLRAYSLRQLLELIKARSNLPAASFEAIRRAVPAIGCETMDSTPHPGFLYVEAPSDAVIQLWGQVDQEARADISTS